MRLTVAGAGPAGSSAAISASLAGAQVALHDRSVFPRHKVCGEFLSPEMLPVLERLGVDLASRNPARIRRLRLRFPRFEKNAPLPEPAYGLSRYNFDLLLLERAQQLGASLIRGAATADTRPLVSALGRRHSAMKGKRLFGFKAHFQGPVTDAIELHFLDGAYVGINCVESGVTNVCGIASEAALKAIGFNYDDFLHADAALRDRLTPLNRSMDWMTVGPLVYGTRFHDQPVAGVYPAGDELSFVDPFTGTGLASAIITGSLAGQFAAAERPLDRYLAECSRVLSSPFFAATLFRMALSTRGADFAAAILPARWLVRLTRPRPRASVGV